MIQEKNAPKVLVIIVTWNKRDYVLALLESFRDLEYPRQLMDILVVDNASEDDTVEAIRKKYPDVQLIRNSENLGGTGGFNTGLKWAFDQPAEKYRYLWLLDNDVRLHRRTLMELVGLLEEHPDAAVAGSTMMQLDYPWRLNEMGAFLDYHSGELVLNRFTDEVEAWKGLSLEQMRLADPDLTRYLMNCLPFMDVEYVAAASLLVRADVARDMGLWRDFFIHYDDVEWCLRIARAGWRILVSARSLIWHMSAAAKVPTWVLYYDNRNILYLIREHGFGEDNIRLVRKRILKKALYYTLIGHPELAGLHLEAIDDFEAGRTGKKDIRLEATYRPNAEIGEVFTDPSIRRVLVPWTINMQASGIQAPIVRAIQHRKDLEFHITMTPDGFRIGQMPRGSYIALPKFGPRRWLRYLKMRGQYDLVMQSDYQKVIGLSWIGARILFVNDEGFCLQNAPKLKDVWKMLRELFRRRPNK